MRAVITTGVSRGLGAALFDEFNAAGDRILAIGRRFTDAQHALQREMPERIRLHAADLEDPASLPSAAEISDFMSAADDVVVVHNAGLLAGVGAIGTLDATEVQRCVAVNLTAPILLTNSVLASEAGSGSTDRALTVLFLSSAAARLTIGGLAVYGATKRGGEQFFTALAAQLADNPRVRVVNVDPGSVDTDMQAQLRSDAPRFPAGEFFVRMHERGELVSVQDAARAIIASHLDGR